MVSRPLDQTAYDLALNQARALMNLDFSGIKFDPAKHPRLHGKFRSVGDVKKAFTGMKREEVRMLPSGVSIRKKYASYRVHPPGDNVGKSHKSLTDASAAAFKHHTGIVGIEPQKSSVGKSSGVKVKRDPKSTYEVKPDNWGMQGTDMPITNQWNVNFGYYGVSGQQSDVPRWATGNTLRNKADAEFLLSRGDEIGKAILDHTAAGKNKPHPLGAALFGQSATEPHMRLTVKKVPEGFVLTDFDGGNDFRFVVKK